VRDWLEESKGVCDMPKETEKFIGYVIAEGWMFVMLVSLYWSL